MADRDNICGNCMFWDVDSPDHDEVLVRQYDKHKRFACRQSPTLIYKNPDEWCGQHRAKPAE